MSRLPEVSGTERERIGDAMARLPLAFERNQGQAAADVEFLTRAPGYMLQLTAAEMRLVVKASVARPGKASRVAATTDRAPVPAHLVKMTWRDANPHAAATPEAVLTGTVNYLKGADPAKWQTAVPTYARVRYEAIYPGIDVVYYGNGRQLEYDVIVAPHADPGTARLVLEGASVSQGDNGGLVLELSHGRVLDLRAPVAYQDLDGARRAVDARYRLLTGDRAPEVTFELGAYDPERPLVIDPLVYSTFLGGGSADVGNAIAVNAAGEAFITGSTADAAIDLPTTAGAFDTVISDEDVFVARLNSAGTALIYSTYLGGSSWEWGLGIAVNSANEAFVTGTTRVASTTYPTTVGAFDTTHNGNEDVFVTRLNASGSALIYSTLVGGIGYESGNGIVVNAANEAFITGNTTQVISPNLVGYPVTAGAFATLHLGGEDAFITKLNSAGTALVYSTYLGGDGKDLGHGIAINGLGEVFVTGETSDPGMAFPPPARFPTTVGAFDTSPNGLEDVFIARFNPAGSGLIYSTLLGGSAADVGNSLAINAADEAFVTGSTEDGTVDLPTTLGAFDTSQNGNVDAFVARLNSAGSALGYSTFLGGSREDVGRGIVVTTANRVLVTGYTDDATTDFPTTPGAVDTTHNGGHDVFMASLDAPGAVLVYSTLLGGNSDDLGHGIAATAAGEVYLTGKTGFDPLAGPAAFPTTAGAFDTGYNGGNSDVFIARLTIGAAGPAPTTVGDSYTTAASTPLTVSAPGVLANDNSNGGGAMTAALVSTAANGALSLVADGGFVYTPNGGFSGTDTFTYRAVNVAGPGTTATVSIAVGAPVAPAPPTNLRVTAVAGNLVTFDWIAPSSGPAPTGFQIEGGVLPGQVLGSLPLGLAPSVTVGLPAGSWYMRVRTVGGSAVSGPSNEVLAHVNVPVPPSTPAGMLGLVAGSSVDLAWTNTWAGGPPSNVVLDVTGSLSGSLPLGLTERFSFAAVPPGTYTFSVRALNVSGSSTASNPVTLTFPGPCGGAPLPVTGFVAYNVGATVFVRWDLPATGPAPTGFVLNVTGDFVGSFATPTRGLSGAVPPGSYAFTVVSTNPCGASAPTAVRTVTVP